MKGSEKNKQHGKRYSQKNIVYDILQATRRKVSELNTKIL